MGIFSHGESGLTVTAFHMIDITIITGANLPRPSALQNDHHDFPNLGKSNDIISGLWVG